MKPESRHRFSFTLILQSTDIKKYLLDPKLGEDEAELPLSMLTKVFATLTIGPNLYSHITILPFKAHFLRDYFFKCSPTRPRNL